MDSVRFSARRDSKAEIDSIVQVPKNSAVSPEFVRNVKESARQMLETLESKFPELKKAMIESGFKIITCREIGEIPFPMCKKKDFFQSHYARSFMKRLNKFKQWDPECCKKKISSIIHYYSLIDKPFMLVHKSDIAAFKSDIAVLQTLDPLQLKDEQLKLLFWYTYSLARIVSSPPCFCNVSNTIILPEGYLLDKFGSYRSRPIPVLEGIIWHETSHFIDDNIGFLQTGQPLSESPPFRQAIEKNLQEAQKKGIIPEMSSKIKFVPLEYCLPVDGWLAYHGGLDSCFRESFAEIGAVAAGGEGGCGQEVLEALCPESIELMKEQFKKLPGQKVASGG